MQKIAFFEIEGWEEEIIRKQFPNDEIYLTKEKLDETNLPEKKGFHIISIFVDSRITPAVLDNFPDLKCIATRSTGFDHIDIAECEKRGITVVYVPGYGDNTVAEFAFGLILNLTRKIYQSIDQVKETGSFSFQGLRGIDLKGKTLGIIGTGRIGRQMINMAKGFDMHIVASDPYPDKDFAVKAGFEYLSLVDLLKVSDVISIHCPLLPQTRHLLNKDNIDLIKQGAYLVNTARGPIVETDALIEALRKGILAGAGLDVLEEEGETKDEINFLAKVHPQKEELKTILQNHILMKMPNVLVTPHNAFNSQEALESILNTTISNIKSFLNRKPVNIAKIR